MIPAKKLVQVKPDNLMVRCYDQPNYEAGSSIVLCAGTVLDIGRWHCVSPSHWSAIVMSGDHRGAHIFILKGHCEAVSPLVALAYEAQ